MPTDLLTAGTPAYDENRGAFNLLLDQRPAAIAVPSSVAEAASAIAEARSLGLGVTAQRTGHGADPLGPLDETLLVRTAELTGLEIDADARRARVGAGVLWAKSCRTPPSRASPLYMGSSKTVGIAGYMLGGGIGWYGRKHGLGCNSVTAIELVDAGGDERRVDAENEPELFWALRGGGGDRSTSPEPLRGKSFAIVEAVYLGDEEAGAELLAPLRDLGPAMDTFATVPPAVLADLHMDPPEPGPAFYDGMLLGDLDAAALETWLEVVGPGSGSPLVSAELRHTSGALSRPAPGGGVLSSLRGGFLQFAVGIVAEPGLRGPITDRIDRLEGVMKPWGAGFLRSFSSRSIDLADAFDAPTAERLRAAKATYDPDGLFISNQPVVSG